MRSPPVDPGVPLVQSSSAERWSGGRFQIKDSKVAATGIAKVGYTHDAMVDQLIATPHISQGELASIFGYSQTWVSQVINSDAFQARLAHRKEQLADPLIIRSIEERPSAASTSCWRSSTPQPSPRNSPSKPRSSPPMPSGTGRLSPGRAGVPACRWSSRYLQNRRVPSPGLQSTVPQSGRWRKQF
jgi:hypothetical protein